MLFQRISFLKKPEEQLESYFQYELAPYPLSLFDEKGMRETQKSALYDAFVPIESQLDSENTLYVIDGGFLLHKIFWHQRESYSAILDKYVEYVKRHYLANAIIVFDGYPEDIALKSTKTAERLRRLRTALSPAIHFDEKMTATVSQEKFLSNERNNVDLS